MTNIHYCTGWSRHKKSLIKPLSADKARTAHESGIQYAVLLGDPEHPDCIVEFLQSRFISVDFLDAFQRIYLDYSFQEVDGRPDELFLSMACIREFAELTDDPIRGAVCFFKPDGELVIDHTEYNPATRVERIVAREELHTDVSGHWEPYPEFGHYEGLSRIRNIPHLKL